MDWLSNVGIGSIILWRGDKHISRDTQVSPGLWESTQKLLDAEDSHKEKQKEFQIFKLCE